MRNTKVKALRKTFAVAAQKAGIKNETHKINRRKATIRIPGHALDGQTYETYTNYNPFKAAWRAFKKAHA